MRLKLLAAAISAFALAVPGTAMAAGSQGGNAGSGGNGQAQLSAQSSKTLQAALSEAKANQNGVNSNTPVNTAGGNVNAGGSNSATQNNMNNAASSADSRTWGLIPAGDVLAKVIRKLSVSCPGSDLWWVLRLPSCGSGRAGRWLCWWCW